MLRGNVEGTEGSGCRVQTGSLLKVGPDAQTLGVREKEEPVRWGGATRCQGGERLLG